MDHLQGEDLYRDSEVFMHYGHSTFNKTSVFVGIFDMNLIMFILSVYLSNRYNMQLS